MKRDYWIPHSPPRLGRFLVIAVCCALGLLGVRLSVAGWDGGIVLAGVALLGAWAGVAMVRLVAVRILLVLAFSLILLSRLPWFPNGLAILGVVPLVIGLSKQTAKPPPPISGPRNLGGEVLVVVIGILLLLITGELEWALCFAAGGVIYLHVFQMGSLGLKISVGLGAYVAILIVWSGRALVIGGDGGAEHRARLAVMCAWSRPW